MKNHTINITGKPARKIILIGKPQRSIEPEMFAKLLDDEICGKSYSGDYRAFGMLRRWFDSILPE